MFKKPEIQIKSKQILNDKFNSIERDLKLFVSKKKLAANKTLEECTVIVTDLIKMILDDGENGFVEDKSIEMMLHPFKLSCENDLIKNPVLNQCLLNIRQQIIYFKFNRIGLFSKNNLTPYDFSTFETYLYYSQNNSKYNILYKKWMSAYLDYVICLSLDIILHESRNKLDNETIFIVYDLINEFFNTISTRDQKYKVDWNISSLYLLLQYNMFLVQSSLFNPSLYQASSQLIINFKKFNMVSCFDLSFVNSYADTLEKNELLIIQEKILILYIVLLNILQFPNSDMTNFVKRLQTDRVWKKNIFPFLILMSYRICDYQTILDNFYKNIDVNHNKGNESENKQVLDEIQCFLNQIHQYLNELFSAINNSSNEIPFNLSLVLNFIALNTNELSEHNGNRVHISNHFLKHTSVNNSGFFHTVLIVLNEKLERLLADKQVIRFDNINDPSVEFNELIKGFTNTINEKIASKYKYPFLYKLTPNLFLSVKSAFINKNKNELGPLILYFLRQIIYLYINEVNSNLFRLESEQLFKTIISFLDAFVSLNYKYDTEVSKLIIYSIVSLYYAMEQPDLIYFAEFFNKLAEYFDIGSMFTNTINPLKSKPNFEGLLNTTLSLSVYHFNFSLSKHIKHNELKKFNLFIDNLHKTLVSFCGNNGTSDVTASMKIFFYYHPIFVLIKSIKAELEKKGYKDEYEIIKFYDKLVKQSEQFSLKANHGKKTEASKKKKKTKKQSAPLPSTPDGTNEKTPQAPGVLSNEKNSEKTENCGKQKENHSVAKNNLFFQKNIITQSTDVNEIKQEVLEIPNPSVSKVIIEEIPVSESLVGTREWKNLSKNLGNMIKSTPVNYSGIVNELLKDLCEKDKNASKLLLIDSKYGDRESIEQRRSMLIMQMLFIITMDSADLTIEHKKKLLDALLDIKEVEVLDKGTKEKVKMAVDLVGHTDNKISQIRLKSKLPFLSAVAGLGEEFDNTIAKLVRQLNGEAELREYFEKNNISVRKEWFAEVEKQISVKGSQNPHSIHNHKPEKQSAKQPKSNALHNQFKC